AFRRLVRGRGGDVVDARGLAAIDRAETARGREHGRPRVKLGTVPALVAAAKGRRRWKTPS
ncbi:ferredoxin-NADP reductase, partial [Streptomyces sp. SID2119]|nr:ferredoxin-NADP reductase [Streptomyces sp. SID2119]